MSRPLKALLAGGAAWLALRAWRPQTSAAALLEDHAAER
jgi:hypothetical protein